ncbi:hypothetical protein M569_05126 [Genlisea aurea]|uniref:Aspartic peptidase DDI1-type domain-containing protein n=1 Tax=Genlisea aurea TaxID=192259 RepID=S8CQZ4_9LAMI|nr:hypothetical protein M569_05126 [Genlisea aurea]
MEEMLDLVKGISARLSLVETTLDQHATKIAEYNKRIKGKSILQPTPNLIENVCAVTLRSGHVLQETVPKMKEAKEQNVTLEKEPDVIPQAEATIENDDKQEVGAEGSAVKQKESEKDLKPTVRTFYEPPPFPGRFRLQKKQEEEKELLKLFGKIELNIPLIEAIKTVPRYAKFLKDLCTNKRRLKGNECINLNEQVSAVFSRKKVPEKCKDPGVFTIPCTIGTTEFKRAMIDLGASINLMPYSIYSALKLGPLQETGIIIKLADRSNTSPEGMVEDVLVQVNNLVFPADFYVLKMGEAEHDDFPLLLGRPFLKTAGTKIDVKAGTLSMEFDGEKVQFNIYEAIRYPSDKGMVNMVETVDEVENKIMELKEEHQRRKRLAGSGYDVTFREEADAEGKLMKVLKECKNAIVWMVDDIKGIDVNLFPTGRRQQKQDNITWPFVGKAAKKFRRKFRKKWKQLEKTQPGGSRVDHCKT